LSSTTTPVTIATPTATIQYNVQGTTTATGCSSNSTIEIDVLTQPTAAETESATAICTGGSVVFDGSQSVSGTTFAWTFPGGNPATSNASSATVTYAAAGNYTATLIVSNSCGADTVVSQTIAVGCTGIDPLVMKDPSAFYNADQHQLQIAMPVSEDGFIVNVFDNMGQLVRSFSTKNSTEIISAETFAAGIYTLRVMNGNTNYTMKFVKE
jgi:hypothetical protein